MIRLRRWFVRTLLAFAALVLLVWTIAEVAQWRFRRNAEQLLAEVRQLHTGMPKAQADALLARWKDRGEVESGCRQDSAGNCWNIVRLFHRWPEWTGAVPYSKGTLWPERIAGWMGFRAAGAGAQLDTQDGRITGTAYFVDIELLVDDHFNESPTFLTSVFVGSGEVETFRESYFVSDSQPLHPTRSGHSMKGGWGWFMAFLPTESAEERARLMDFHLECLTRWTPCRTEGELLPEAGRMRAEAYPEEQTGH